MKDEYYLYIEDQQKGPYTLMQLHNLWNAGGVTSQTLYWQHGFDEWFPLSTMLETLEPPQSSGFPQRAPIPTPRLMAYAAPPDSHLSKPSQPRRALSSPPEAPIPTPRLTTYAPPPVSYLSRQSQSAQYAGFWRRAAAFLLDMAGLHLVMFGPALAIFLALRADGARDREIQDVVNLLGMFVGWLYFALMESSRLQATLGKLMLGITVTDLDGNRIGFGRATGRHFAKFLSGIPLFLGFFSAAYTPKKQGFHDRLARCLVVRK